MRHRSSPRCSNCWERGHTSNHCPRIKEAAAKGDAWAIRKIEQQKQAVKNRRCSYCHAKGHNKRGCAKRKADRIIFDTISARFQSERVQWLKEKGVTVGSLARYKSAYSKKNEGTIALVTKMLVENRIPIWTWVQNNYAGEEGDNARAAYGRCYHNGFPKNHHHKEDVVLHLESVTGNGLGYWGEDANTSVSSYEAFSTSHGVGLEVVS